METVKKFLGGAIPVILLLVWWTWGFRARYEWAGRIEQQKQTTGWTVVDRDDSLITLSEPWTLFYHPVTRVVFVHPKSIVQDVSGIFGAKLLKVDYNDGVSDEKETEIAVDCSKKLFTRLTDEFETGGDFSKLKWESVTPDQSNAKVLDWVCQQQNVSLIRDSLNLNDDELGKLSELLTGLEREDFSTGKLKSIQEFFSVKTSQIGRKFSKDEINPLLESLKLRAETRKKAADLAQQSFDQNKVVDDESFNQLLDKLAKMGRLEKNEADFAVFLITRAAEHKATVLNGKEIQIERFIKFLFDSNGRFEENANSIDRVVQGFTN